MRKQIHFTARFCLCASLLLGLPGCAAPALALLEIGAGTGASAGVSHTLNGITYKTFTASAEDIHQATRRALGAMGIPIDADQSDAQLRKISAHANDRDITIEIEEVTPKTSRLRVVAAENYIFKDSATASEIIVQASQAFDDMQAARPKSRARIAKSPTN